ncbi:hypothetical protein [Bacillus sp. B-jedd]|uniref:hypothetical protein n=1 Tax=Bacillus sp. B-jedd TaxID=1476857 RepID=UPI0005156B6E|nr:hypothetical protein [Bacillus sp. B-jedd]CEG28517.1 hypothetical protein BN1002_03438 [Bacillus sp. B-jedd]
MASLGAMKSELQSIISELESIASGLQTEFEGIGSEVAAHRLRSVIQQCESAQRGLNSVDITNIAPEFKKDAQKA